MIKRYFLIIEALLKNEQGLSRAELNKVLVSEGEKPFLRKGFQKATAAIFAKTGVKITPHDCGKNVWRYRIDRHSLEDYDGERLLGNMLANMMQAVFLHEFRDLGSKIQPVIIARGTEYLRPIGIALRHSRKLAVTYQKFDEEPYDAILHPYCLKVFAGRWYVFAYKEHSAHTDVAIQCFSLDRIKALSVTNETFQPSTSVDPINYFRHAYGIYVDYKSYPIRDIIIACTQKVANYLRTLPLHHSQRELAPEQVPADLRERSKHLPSVFFFSFHLSLSPDFIGELNRWNEEVIMLQPC